MLGNFGNMVEVIQKVQQNVQSIQEVLQQERLESSSGDIVHVVMNGTQEVVAIHLNPSYLSADNKALLEDLLIACLNDASRQSRERNRSAMGKLTQDFNLPPIPGLF